jgi:hypothetical protein
MVTNLESFLHTTHLLWNQRRLTWLDLIEWGNEFV